MALILSLIACNCLWHPLNTKITTNTQLETRENDNVPNAHGAYESCHSLISGLFLYKLFILTNIHL